MHAPILPGGIRIQNAPGEEDLSGLLSETCEKALAIIETKWGLKRPPDTRIYVMTSWWRFFLDAAPWYVTMLYVRMFPFWLRRIERLWAVAGGWTQRFGRYVAIGVKPPRLLKSDDATIGRLLFTEEPDLRRKMEQVLCHELAHACAMRLRLPAWLNEAIAIHTVDEFSGHRTVREDTRERVRSLPLHEAPFGYRKLTRLDDEGMALQVARGYWLVERLERQVPGFFRRQFANWKGAGSLEREMARVLGLPAGQFWSVVDRTL